MISAKLPLSTETCLVLKPSIMSMMTSGSSCGCFTLLASSSENTISLFSLLWCFDGSVVRTLLICLCCEFFRDLKDPPVTGPSLIILISPIALFGRSYCLSLSLGLSSDLGLWSCLYHPCRSLLMNFCSFPFWISSSICSFKSLHSSM